MAHKTFQEYLDTKSKFSTKGKIEAKADYSGPKESAPKKENKHKDAGGKGQGQPKPYKGGKDAKDPNKGKLDGGFADKGDKDLKYTPGDKEKGNFITGGKEAAGVPGGKTVSSDWNKTKTQEWLNRTKGMSLAEFTKMIQKTTSKGIDKITNECACQESANDVVRQAVALANANQSVMITLVREMKRNKAFGKMVAEMLQHDETYKVMAHFMERDEKYARRLVRAMNEMVGPPAHKDDIDDDDDDPSKPPHPEDMHGSDDDMDMGMGDDDMGMGGDDMGLGGPPHGHHGHHDMDGPHGHPMGGDDMGLGGDDDMGMGGMGGDDMGLGGDDMGLGGDDHDPTMGPHGHHGDKDADLAPGSKIMPTRKKKKKHAHHHLMAALKDSPMGQDAGGMGAMGGGNLSM